MDSMLLAAEVRSPSVDATGAGSVQLYAQATRFEALLRAPPTSPAPLQGGPSTSALPSIAFGDRYTDEVAPERSTARAVVLPDEVSKLGQSLSDEMRQLRSKFDSSSKNITDPYLLELRDQVNAVVQYQDAITRLAVTMKSVELSVQSCNQLFKMQG